MTGVIPERAAFDQAASGTDSRRIGGFNQQSELVDVAGLPGSRCTHQEIPEDVVFPADPDRRAVGVIGDELGRPVGVQSPGRRSEEHTSELQSLMRISYAVF